MKHSQQGFTLIELVMVIVILGILAATALPKFIDLSDEAERAAAEGIAGALSSASTINYAAAKVGNANAYTTASQACDDVANALLDDYDSTRFNIATTTISGSEGTVSDCEILDSSSASYSPAINAKVMAVTGTLTP